MSPDPRAEVGAPLPPIRQRDDHWKAAFDRGDFDGIHEHPDTQCSADFDRNTVLAILARPAPPSEGLDELRALSEAATPGPWKSIKGYRPDKFAPKGYRYVQFGPTEKKANGRGTDQLMPEDADLIVAAVNYLRAALPPADPSAAKEADHV